MKITAVRCFQVFGQADYPPNEERQVGMLDVYPEYARRPVARAAAASGPRSLTAAYVEVAADDGPSGIFGPIFPETATIVRAKLAPWLVGQDPLASERVWDVLYRQDRHARKGYEMMAISAVDCALWDLRGKAYGQPIYRLLGGPTRERIDCYASMLGHSLELERVRERARLMVEQGYKA